MLTKKQIKEKLDVILNHATDVIYFVHPYGTGLINLQKERPYTDNINPESKVKNIIESFDDITDIEIIPDANIEKYRVIGITVLQVNISLKQREIKLGSIINSPIVKNEIISETFYSAYALIENEYYPVAINFKTSDNVIDGVLIDNDWKSEQRTIYGTELQFSLTECSKKIKTKIDRKYEIFVGKFEYKFVDGLDKIYLDFVSIMKYSHEYKKFIFNENNRLNMNINENKIVHQKTV